MIAGYSPVVQAFLGTLFTWALTAAGAGLVFVFDGKQVSNILKMYLCFYITMSLPSD